MPQNYDSTDFSWTSRGDLAIGHNGDLADTYGDPLRSLYQEIRTRTMSALGDWKLYPNLGANLENYVGEPNDKRTAEAIKLRIIASLAKDGLVNTRDMQIRYIPIDVDKIMFRISISVASSARNGNSNSLGINFLYDYSENHAYFTR